MNEDSFAQSTVHGPMNEDFLHELNGPINVGSRYHLSGHMNEDSTVNSLLGSMNEGGLSIPSTWTYE